MRNLITAAGLTASLLATHGAFAQDTAASGTASTSGNANVGVSLPGATTTATAGTSDHDQMVGRLAVGYFGISSMGAGAALAGGAPTSGANDSPYAVTGSAPVVGVRYWIDPLIGIDVGVGLSMIGGSIDLPAPATDVDRESFTAFLIHAGVPLSLASVDHFSFQVIPELNVGFASGGTDNPDPMVPGEISYSGFHFDVGARVGAEISFGFIKIPQLSLIGSVGLRFDMDKGSTEDSESANPETVEYSSSRSELHTTVGSNPWAIFTNQVAALYYF
jgi:hypothetical protein